MREYHAIRLGLMLAMAMHQNGGFTYAHQPVPGCYEDHWTWLRQALRPLVSQSPTIATAVRLINPDGPAIAWHEPDVLGHHLFQMAAESERLAEAMRAAPRQRRVIPV